MLEILFQPLPFPSRLLSELFEMFHLPTPSAPFICDFNIHPHRRAFWWLMKMLCSEKTMGWMKRLVGSHETFFFTIIEFPQLQFVDYILIVIRLCLLSFSASPPTPHPTIPRLLFTTPTIIMTKRGEKKFYFYDKNIALCWWWWKWNRRGEWEKWEKKGKISRTGKLTKEIIHFSNVWYGLLWPFHYTTQTAELR